MFVECSTADRNDNDWRPKPGHNICAYLGPIKPSIKEFEGMIEFLRRSRIKYAISVQHACYFNVLKEFYMNAEVDCTTTPTSIKSKIQDQEIVITEDLIRETLKFEDTPEMPFEYDSELILGCFARIKYSRPIAKNSMIHKAYMCTSFKYLAHVLIHCMGTRRGGFDELKGSIQSAMVALILNKPYNFSGMIMEHMKEMIKKRNKPWTLYPRFVSDDD